MLVLKDFSILIVDLLGNVNNYSFNKNVPISQATRRC